MELVGATTVVVKGDNQAPIKPVGHEIKFTVILVALPDATKCKTYMLIHRRQPLP